MAANDFIGVDVQGLEELQAGLEALPEEARDAAVDGVSTYLINVFRAYPPQKYVSNREAYGAPFVSDKQRRWFFAALARGEIDVPYKRTQTLANSWRQEGRGYSSILVNETPYAQFVQEHTTQSRMMALRGWKTTLVVIQERISRIIEVSNGAAQRVIRRLKLG